MTKEEKMIKEKQAIKEKQVIKGKQFDEERALYHLTDTEVNDCVFAGPADGESVLKESKDMRLRAHLWVKSSPTRCLF